MTIRDPNHPAHCLCGYPLEDGVCRRLERAQERGETWNKALMTCRERWEWRRNAGAAIEETGKCIAKALMMVRPPEPMFYILHDAQNAAYHALDTWQWSEERPWPREDG